MLDESMNHKGTREQHKAEVVSGMCNHGNIYHCAAVMSEGLIHWYA